MIKAYRKVCILFLGIFFQNKRNVKMAQILTAKAQKASLFDGNCQLGHVIYPRNSVSQNKMAIRDSAQIKGCLYIW